MTLATMIADYIGKCCGRKKVLSAVLSITVGVIVLGVYSAFMGTVHFGSVVLGVFLYQAVRATMRASERVEQDDDEGDR